MAASASDNPQAGLKDMQEDLACCICLDFLKEPKDLDCSHVFCLHCLQDWVGKQPTIECPECRHITIVPSGGLSNLKTNLRLRNMTDKYAERMIKEKSVPICKIHEGERQHFFCVTCGVTVCQACLVIKHERPSHDIKELKDIVESKKAEMIATLAEVQENVDKSTHKELALAKTAKQVETAIVTELQKVDVRLADAKVKCSQAKELIHQRGKEQLKEIQKQIETARDRTKRLRLAHNSAHNSVTNTPDHLYVVQHASLTDRMGTLTCDDDEDETRVTDPNSADLSFRSSNDADWFGCVGNRVRTLSLHSEFGMRSFKIVQSVASTKKGVLAVVDIDTDSDKYKVHAYRDISGQYEYQFTFDNTEKPVTVASLADGRFLVAESVTVGASIKVFSSTGHYERLFPNAKGNRIATSRDSIDKIIAADADSKVLRVYRPDGHLVATHNTDIEPTEHIYTNGKQIAFMKRSKNKVCVLDFQSGREIMVLDIEYPYGSCFDDDSGSILIASSINNECGRGVIDQYCITTGRLLGHLVTGLYNPMDITFTYDQKLVVADQNSVKVYNME